MVKDIYESICRGEDVRANLICLKQLIADKKEKSAKEAATSKGTNDKKSSSAL